VPIFPEAGGARSQGLPNADAALRLAAGSGQRTEELSSLKQRAFFRHVMAPDCRRLGR